eukprot:TRINITY_DN2241_c0_g1_i1.p2 TRINITY_DN2241_c0_g1~~TRINITY_DN2241_c0_g1_i1.p2  ORF type:complete len:106 (-),score=4.14 TRINITY_DN2241_c0_g1_i1:252-569(-)
MALIRLLKYCCCFSFPSSCVAYGRTTLLPSCSRRQYAALVANAKHIFGGNTMLQQVELLRPLLLKEIHTDSQQACVCVSCLRNYRVRDDHHRTSPSTVTFVDRCP